GERRRAVRRRDHLAHRHAGASAVIGGRRHLVVSLHEHGRILRHGAGAGAAALKRTTMEAVVVWSVVSKPGTGAFEYRSRQPIFSARCAFIAACAVNSTS